MKCCSLKVKGDLESPLDDCQMDTEQKKRLENFTAQKQKVYTIFSKE